MTNSPRIEDELRDRIIAEPLAILDDQDVMRALVEANQKALGGNVVDLRGISMERLEDRFERLEDTHRGVIAAAYENMAGTNQVHRAILRVLDPLDFDTFIADLNGDIADILQVDCMRLILETAQEQDDPNLSRFGDKLTVAEPGFVEDYLNLGHRSSTARVLLRTLKHKAHPIYGAVGGKIQSEACLKLDFGAGRLPGMLLMGCRDPQQFLPQQGTELLAFFAAVFERAMRRWIS
jgi:uncharacterized protein YigA (DUF484 family)